MLNALLFGANLFLAGILILRYTRSMVAGLMGVLLIMAAPNVFGSHTWIMSEPLYIFLSLLALYMLTDFLNAGRSLTLILLAVVVSLAALTRFVGVSLISAGGLSLLLLSSKSWRRRLAEAFVFGILSSVPVFLWLIRNDLVAGTSVNRELIFHPMRPEILRTYLREAASWFVPYVITLSSIGRAAIAAVLAAVAPAIFVATQVSRRMKTGAWSRGDFWALPWILLFYMSSYLGVLVINSFLLDAGTSLSGAERYLTPFFVVVVIFLVASVHRILVEVRLRRWVKALPLGFGLALIALYSVQSIDLLVSPFDHMGKMALRLNWPEVSTELSQIDPATPLISDNPEFVYILSGRSAYMRPIKFDHYRQKYREDYEQQIEATRRKLAEGGVYVLFDQDVEAELEIIELLEAAPLRSFPIATFYGYAVGEGG